MTVSKLVRQKESNNANLTLNLACFLFDYFLCVLLSTNWDSFLVISRFGSLTLLIQLLTLLNIKSVRHIPIFLVASSFIAFSFGIPMCFALDGSYYNYYLSFLDFHEIALGAKFTLLCLSLLMVGVIFNQDSKQHVTKKYNEDNLLFRAFGNKKNVTRFVKPLLIILFPVMFYKSLQFGLVSFSSGIQAARSSVESTAVYSITRGLFCPLSIMYLVYSEEGERRLLSVLLFSYCLLMTLAGDRTEGLTFLIGVMLCNLECRDDTLNFSKVILLATFGLLITFLISYIAVVRVGGDFSVTSIFNLIISNLSEMGFNFTTVCYEMHFNSEFSYGLGLLAAMIAGIPSRLDFFGFHNVLERHLSETLFNTKMRQQFLWVNFGLGYSIVAEFYKNFGPYGYLFMFPLGIILDRLLDLNTPNVNFNRFVRYSMLIKFFTLPRRGITWFFIYLNWSLFIPILYVIVCSAVLSKHTGIEG